MEKKGKEERRGEEEKIVEDECGIGNVIFRKDKGHYSHFMLIKHFPNSQKHS